MRIARPVGLSQDGGSLIVATPSGEELAVAVDERLHAVLRGDQPRLGQLEIEMDNALGPRDIQSRIRSGQTLEEVGRVAGIPLDRVERFAAPVLAERDHVALLAMASSVRRRGETSGHRLLRLAVTERLVRRGVDIDAVDWDAWRREDGRWSVTANYASGESNRQALFVFDHAARFSVADNDEARWVLGEQSSVKGPQPGRRRPSAVEGEEADTEPTLDLSDELALVRVIQPPEPASDPTDQAGAADHGYADGEVDEELDQDDPADGPAEGPAPEPAGTEQLAPVRGLYPVPDQVAPDDALDPSLAGGDDARRESPLDTLAAMLDSGDDATSGHGPLSDATAVPETDNSGWEPAIVVDYPVEPSLEDLGDGSEVAATPDGPGDGTDVPGPPERIVDGEDRAEEAEELAAEHDAQQAPPAAKGKRKRASVPSWDEIMFGGPTRPR